MFWLELKLQGQRPRNGKVAPFPSLPRPPPYSSPQGPLPHLGTAVSGCVKGSLVPGEPGPHQAHILSIWRGFSLRHPCLGFKRETALSSSWQAKSVLLQPVSRGWGCQGDAHTFCRGGFPSIPGPQFPNPRMQAPCFSAGDFGYQFRHMIPTPSCDI